MLLPCHGLYLPESRCLAASPMPVEENGAAPPVGACHVQELCDLGHEATASRQNLGGRRSLRIVGVHFAPILFRYIRFYNVPHNWVVGVPEQGRWSRAREGT